MLCTKLLMHAVNAATEFDIKMPRSQEEWNRVSADFKNKSSTEIIAGCVGALDGFFQQTNKPANTEVYNVRSYYSSHYK